jgi:peptidoglycan/LPS O-acetylase OafA/YrhL
MATKTLDLAGQKAAARPIFYRPELDVLRFFAFLTVFTCHITLRSPEYFAAHHISANLARACTTISIAGSYGVDLFFVLSAYLITELLLREKESQGQLDVKSFYLRRMLRIWPLYFFFVGLAAVVPFCNPMHQFTARYVIPFLLLLGNWSMVFFGWPESVAVPLWSISVEEQFYLVWPPVVARFGRQGIVVAALMMIGVANASRICVLLLHGTAPQLWGNTFAHLDSIAAGILIAALLRGRTPRIPLAVRVGIVVVAVGAVLARAHFVEVLPHDTLGWGETVLGWPVVAASCAAVLLAFIGLRDAPAPLRYLGKISYGLYVYHLLCIRLSERLLHGGSGPVHMAAGALLAFGLTIACAAVSYQTLEKPFLHLKNRFTYVVSRPA